MDIIQLPIDEITPYENNPRVNDQAVAVVAHSIEEFGFRQPIVVDADRVVIAGHTRLKAARHLGLESVPVHVATGLTEAQVKAYRLADNKSAEAATWDLELLPIELAELQALDVDLSLIGFGDNELAGLLGSEHVSPHAYTSPCLYRITAKSGNTTVDASDNHPFLVWRPTKRNRSIVGGTVDWVRANQLRRGDYTMTPIADESEDAPLPELDEDDWFLFGLYLADGHLQGAGNGDNRYPAFSLNKARTDLADRIWAKWPDTREYDHNDYRPEPGGGTVIMAFDPDAGARFERLGGRLAHAKRLALRVLRDPPGQAARVAARVAQRRRVPGPRPRLLAGEHRLRRPRRPDLPAGRVGRLSHQPLLLRPARGTRRDRRPAVQVAAPHPPPLLLRVGSPPEARVPAENGARGSAVLPAADQEDRAGPLHRRRLEPLRRRPSVVPAAVGLSHNTEKPTELGIRAIEYSSKPGENVLDLFGGSGSTLIGCEQTGRRAFLMELDPLYCDVIVQRWEAFTGKTAKRIPAGEAVSNKEEA